MVSRLVLMAQALVLLLFSAPRTSASTSVACVPASEGQGPQWCYEIR